MVCLVYFTAPEIESDGFRKIIIGIGNYRAEPLQFLSTFWAIGIIAIVIGKQLKKEKKIA